MNRPTQFCFWAVVQNQVNNIDLVGNIKFRAPALDEIWYEANREDEISSPFTCSINYIYVDELKIQPVDYQSGSLLGKSNLGLS